jgi:hypothetical protein
VSLSKLSFASFLSSTPTFVCLVIPLSAGNAFAVRQAHGLTVQSQMRLYNKDRVLYKAITDMVLPNVHQQACRLPDAATLQTIFTALESEVFRSRILAASNFPGFLEALSVCLGDCKEQKFQEEKKSSAGFK